MGGDSFRTQPFLTCGLLRTGHCEPSGWEELSNPTFSNVWLFAQYCGGGRSNPVRKRTRFPQPGYCESNLEPFQRLVNLVIASLAASPSLELEKSYYISNYKDRGVISCGF